jgi:hypothetical protein
MVELFVAGSSAQDNGLQALFRLICEPDSLDIYRVSDGSVRLFFCRSRRGSSALQGFPQGVKIAFHKSSVGGSGSGVGPLIQRTPVEFLNVQDIRAHFAERCPRRTRAYFSDEGVLIGYSEYECANPSAAHTVPDAGISDVEPQYLLASYHLTADAIDAITVRHSNAFIFGIPVTLALRDALQAARFPAGDECNPGNIHYLDDVPAGHGTTVRRGESEQCMPGLGRAQLAGIFSGRLSHWRTIISPDGYPLAFKDPQSGQFKSPPGVKPPGDDRVYVCRRVETSGTQAAYEMFFLKQRCVAGAATFVQASETVTTGSVSGDVASCLSSLDQKKLWGVGMLSTESVESLKKDHWRFIKMDGVAPTLFNSYSGRWPFFVEQSYQWRNDRSGQPLQGPKLQLMLRIGLTLGDPQIIRILDQSFRHAWGSAGIVALSDPGSDIPPLRAAPGQPLSADAVDELPVLAVRHDSSNCGAVVSQYPTAMP